MIISRKALNVQQLMVLRLHNAQQGKAVFSEMDLTLLSQEHAAPFSLYERAHKVIDAYEKWLDQNPSRREIDETCLPRIAHHQFAQSVVVVLREYMAFRQLVVEKGAKLIAEIQTIPPDNITMDDLLALVAYMTVTDVEIDARVKENEEKRATKQQDVTTEKVNPVATKGTLKPEENTHETG